ncbi:MAG: type 1 glutamine amidotransferase [Candidatus Promineifilaceae bacterium]|nr:type 1 glutamine amidotransferase [Candidatus Promineifilaceae bacterium]
MNIKILLLQARRQNDVARLEERQSFADRAGLDIQQIIPHDLLENPPTLAKIRQYDALMVGGSGAFSVSKDNLPYQQTTLDVLTEVAVIGHPLFASCFGFHLLTAALGGQVIYDPDCMEVGTFELTLSEAGAHDELFSYLPPTFQAQLGHKDRARVLPEGVINLASSALVPFQAFRIPDKPIWATQFHPELTGEENLLRFHRYKEEYDAIYGPEQLKAVLDRFNDSPETDELIPRFLHILFR